MQEWYPISLVSLYDKIMQTQTLLVGEDWNFWQLIKIDPSKWNEQTYGTEGDGFWVVAICGSYVI